MAMEDASPVGPVCPGTGQRVSVVDIYGALYDVERRIHVIRTLLGRLSPDIPLVYGDENVSATWAQPPGADRFPRVICNQCEPAVEWPK